MYCLVPEKPLRLVYETFYLAIGAYSKTLIHSGAAEYVKMDNCIAALRAYFEPQNIEQGISNVEVNPS